MAAAGKGGFAGVRAVSYDLWCTLVQDRDGERVWVERARRLGDVLDVDRETARAALRAGYRAHHAAWERGRAMSFPALVEAVVVGAGRSRDGQVATAVAAALEEPTRDLGVEVLPGAIEALDRLAGGGLAVGLVCDTGFSSGRLLRQVLADVGLLRFFSVLVFSDEVGEPKPAAPPFERLLAGLEEVAPAVVHVGDLRRKDVAGARAMGLRTVRYRGARDDASGDGDLPDADAVIDDHRALPGLLGW